MIETNRLLIKPLTSQELKKHIESPGAFAQEIGLIPSESLVDKDTKDAILNDLLPNIADISKDTLFYTMWIIIEKNQKAIIGGICFHGEPNEYGEVEIGYGIDIEYRNMGYMTETISGVIQWAKKNKKVKSITAETESTNIPSIKVLDKNGFEVNQRNSNTVQMRLELNKIISDNF
ncbi:MAG TPA: GNAT family N-acetyltransferase [Bacteroidales bacterium]|nr:GNAT family N-acetyltransferase [Bacteroidales bacterium]